MAEPKKQTTPKLRVFQKKKTKKKSTRKRLKFKKIRFKKLFRGKTPQEKRELQALRQKKREESRERLEEFYSIERYVPVEEAMGPAIYNPLYLKRAAIYRVCRYVVMTALIVFLIAMLNFFKDEITIENFRYLIRNVNFELKTELTDPGIISYDSSEQNQFAVYKESLVQLSDRKFAIYDAGGRSSYVGNLNYSSPALRTSDKYVLAFDRDSGKYSLYTGFSQAYEGTTDFPIADADLTDNGVHVIASRSKAYTGVVSVYSASFRLMNRIQKNKYIASVDLTADGKHLLIASYAIGERGIVTELMTIAVNSDTPTLLLTLEGILPWKAAWLGDGADGTFALICDEGVKFINTSGKIYAQYGFSNQNVIEYKVSSLDRRVAIISREKSNPTDSHLYVLDENGNILTHQSFSLIVEKIAFFQNEVIVLSGNVAWKITDTAEVSIYEADVPLQAAAAKGNTLYICTPTKVISPDWKNQSDKVR